MSVFKNKSDFFPVGQFGLSLCCILEAKKACLYHLPICQNEMVVLGKCCAVTYAKVNRLFSIY